MNSSAISLVPEKENRLQKENGARGTWLRFAALGVMPTENDTHDHKPTTKFPQHHFDSETCGSYPNSLSNPVIPRFAIRDDIRGVICQGLLFVRDSILGRPVHHLKLC